MNKIQQEIIEYFVEREWHTLTPGSLAKSISIEAAELLEHFQLSEPSKEEILADPAKFEELRHEVADVIIYAIELSDALGVDFEDAVREKLAKVRIKYPAELVRGRNAEYQAIKKQSREGRK